MASCKHVTSGQGNAVLDSYLLEQVPTTPKAPTKPKKTLDFNHLCKYTLGDIALEREVLTLFIDQVPLTIGELKKAANQKAWYAAAHTLKGSARAVGAFALADLALEAEKLTDENSRGGMIARLEVAQEDVRNVIADYCRQ